MLFTDLALDRKAEHRDDRPWLDALEQAPTSRFLVLDPEARILSLADGRAPRLLTPTERRRHLGDIPASLLGVDGEDRGYFLLRANAEQVRTSAGVLSAQTIGLRHAGARFSRFDAGLFAYASALAQWQARTRHCPCCGAPLSWISSGHRARCTQCDTLQFPRSDPAIIVIVEHEGACLLGRQPGWPQGLYSTLAGFVEPGEGLEDAVRREVDEETGVTVTHCRYLASQPWPFPASLMLGFSAQALARDIHLRDGELEHAAWFTPGDIVHGVERGSLQLPSRLSVSRYLLAHWMGRQAGIDLETITDT